MNKKLHRQLTCHYNFISISILVSSDGVQIFIKLVKILTPSEEKGISAASFKIFFFGLCIGILRKW